MGCGRQLLQESDAFESWQKGSLWDGCESWQKGSLWDGSESWAKHVSVPGGVYMLFTDMAFGCNHAVGLACEVGWEPSC